ncbi:MAG: pyrimidine-nucleoside phosphorylase, partial [Megasphaera micronuciformis]|nr:pyrimidine-nucleoside phosphorylase [Megasphaera micronuciformis]
MWPVDFIEEKRDGKEQSASRIEKIIEDYTQG